MQKCNFCGKPLTILTKEKIQVAAGVDNKAFICENCNNMLYSVFGSANLFEDDCDEEIAIPKMEYTPKEIKNYLDDFVIGQDKAKKTLSVQIYNHYKRINNMEKNLGKSNILLVGPSGCGKTELARTIANFLNVPFVIADATSLTEAGYVGDDVENVLVRLVQAADGDIKKAEQGIIFIDEIDKIGRKSESTSITRDVSGEGVQQALLKLIEGAVVRVPTEGGRKHPNGPSVYVDTKNILFICSGAFEGLDSIIEKRTKSVTSFGFESKTTEPIDTRQQILTKDIISFGLIPELVGRLPIIAEVQKLDRDDLVKILIEPKNSIIKQYQELLALEDIDLEIEKEVLEIIANKCLENNTGARGLRSIIEDIMEDVMFEVPDYNDIEKVILTKDIFDTKKAIYERRKTA